jgi:hypothetical protein
MSILAVHTERRPGQYTKSQFRRRDELSPRSLASASPQTRAGAWLRSRQTRLERSRCGSSNSLGVVGRSAGGAELEPHDAVSKRLRVLTTRVADHLPPRAVAYPLRSNSCAADRADSPLSSTRTGRMRRAKASALAILTATPRAQPISAPCTFVPLGLPSFVPRLWRRPWCAG